jgi:hypothetical protein
MALIGLKGLLFSVEPADPPSRSNTQGPLSPGDRVAAANAPTMD